MFVQPHSQVPATPLTSTLLITKFGLLLFLGVFGLFNTGPACALEITSKIKHYYAARDSSVTLHCEFVLASDDLGYTEIEWTIVPPDRDKDDYMILWYTGGILYDNLYGPLEQRFHFASPQPQVGIASVTMTDLMLTDSGTYQCKVKKLPGIVSMNIILSVMERPSKPLCYVEGQAVAGEDLRLRCRSSQGTPPLVYRWAKTSGLPLNAFVDTVMGDLYLKKISERDCGTYLCEVESLVGREECRVVVSFTSLPTKNYVPDTTVAAVVSVVVIIVMVIITVICCRCRKKTEEESGNRILVDEHPSYPWPSRKREPSQGSVQTHLNKYRNMDRKLKHLDMESAYMVMGQVVKACDEAKTHLNIHKNMDKKLKHMDTESEYVVMGQVVKACDEAKASCRPEAMADGNRECIGESYSPENPGCMLAAMAEENSGCMPATPDNCPSSPQVWASGPGMGDDACPWGDRGQ